MAYFVYCYKFEDGSIYIGRSQDSQKRFGVASKYVGQEVYKHMMNEDYIGFKIYESDNPFIICYMEHRLINKFYDISHNGSIEDRWLVNASDLCAKETDIDVILNAYTYIDDLINQRSELNDFVDRYSFNMKELI